jgi:ribose transport system substrate-binding protein
MRSRRGGIAWALTVCLCSIGCSKSGSSGTAASTSNTQAAECAAAPPLTQKPSYKIGFIQIYEPTNAYTIANSADFVAEAKKRGYTLIYDAPTTADPAEQIARVKALIDAKVDAIVMKPLAQSLPITIAARKACIPVFTESRFFDSPPAAAGTDYITHVGTDSAGQGQAMAEWLAKAKGGKASILELEGTPGTSSGVGRKNGFEKEVATHPGLKILASRAANFDRNTAHDVARDLLKEFPTADVIYAANDQMVLGALAAVKESGKVPGKDIILLSIDGFKESVEHVIDGSIAAIVFNDPRLAAVTYDTIERYATGWVPPPRVVVKGPIIDSSNAKTMVAEAF